ncbi:MAG: bifunctional nuclease family protein [Candidatus Rokuibacteriota bacterium]
MTRHGRAGLLALLIVSLTTSAAARDPGEGPPPAASGPQEVEVVALALDQQTQVPVIVLQGKRDRRNLLMTIDAAQAVGIAMPLNGVTPPRPLTHDLFLTLFGRLNINLTRVVITDFRNDVYYAIVHLAADGTQLTLDARPSDAIALAIRAKVPVLVEERVFEKSGAVTAPRRPSI